MSSHKFQIKNGKPELFNKELFDNDLGRFQENQIGILSLDKYEDQETSNAQYGFLFGFLIPEISKEYGESILFIKETLKYAFNPVHIRCRDLKTGNMIEQKTGGSLSRARCSKKKLTEVIQGAIDWALELGINVPDLDNWSKNNPVIISRYKNI